jgi:hypothetical protein
VFKGLFAAPVGQFWGRESHCNYLEFQPRVTVVGIRLQKKEYF